MQRLRLGEVIAAAGGVALLGLMWAPWYEGTNAWGAFAVIDVVLALAALLGIAAAGVGRLRRIRVLPGRARGRMAGDADRVRLLDSSPDAEP